MKIEKRNGSYEDYNEEKILNACVKAGMYVSEARFVEACVMADLYGKEDIRVVDIEACVIDSMNYLGFTKEAEKYESYARERTAVRGKDAKLLQSVLGILKGDDEELLRENANKASERIPTQRDLIAGQVIKHYVREHLLPPHVAKAHDEGIIHVHDMDYIGMDMVNCCLVDVENMLKNGFRMGNAQIEQPNSVTTATAITAQIIAQVASHNYGGTTVAEIDRVLEPYVMKSYHKHHATMFKYVTSGTTVAQYATEQTIKEIRSAIQGLEYEINTLHTSNGQTPFVTLTFGRGTSWASREVQKAILEQRIQGLGKEGITPVFPKLCFIREDGINQKEGDPNYDIKQLAIKCSSKRLYPDYLDVTQLQRVTGGVPSPMGCRSFLPTYDSGVYNGRNNMGVVSVNLVRCALGAKTKGEFFQNLHEAIILAKQALDVRVESCKKIKAKVAPILYEEGAFGTKAEDPEELVFNRFFAGGRATISLGYIGLYEVCKLMTGAGHHESEVAHEFAQSVLAFMKRFCTTWKDWDGLGWSLYGTPAEGLCGRFASLDKEKFGNVEGITDKGYYQNGFNVDVRAKINPMEKAMVEAKFPNYATGGFICYGELPDMRKNLEGLEQVIDFALDRVPYYAINTPTDVCGSCHFEGEFTINKEGRFECPSCGNSDPKTIKVIRRVSGYLASPENRPMPLGKTAEVVLREKNL